MTRWLRRLGGDSGMAWCGAFAAAMLDSAGDVISPGVRSLVARRYRTKESVRAWDAALGRVAIGRGWLGIMEFGAWQGHVFFVDHQVSRKTLATIEGNTSLGGAGPQRDGGYVAARRRTITSSGPIRWFTPVRTRGVNPHGRDSPRPADVAMAASLRHILEVELRWL